MKVRKATLTDKKQILILVRKFYGKSSPINVEGWKKKYKKLIKLTYVVEINRKIIAYILPVNAKKSLYICDLYVLPRFRRKGIATKLLIYSEKLKKKLKKKHLIVTNRKRDRHAYKLYTKFGFRIKELKNKNSWIMIK